MYIKSGVLFGAKQLSSPNYDDRPENTLINLLVIHCISLPPKVWGAKWIQALFTNTLDPHAHPYFAQIYDLKVSAHLFIERDGRINQFVNFSKRAWHAGQSSFNSVPKCNDYSIGIELNGFPSQDYTESQYESLAKVAQIIMKAYPHITSDRITGHDFIAPGRKEDPGPAFDWSKFRKMLGY